MKKYRFPVLALAGALIIGGCSEKSASSNINEPVAGARVVRIDGSRFIEDAIAMVPGSVSGVSSSIDDKSGAARVAVSVTPSTGGLVVVHFDAEQNIVAGIEGKGAAVHAVVEPGPYFIPVSLAVDLARREVAGEVQGWSFERDPRNNLWVYNVEILDDSDLRHSVVLNAISKSIIESSPI